MHKNTIFVPNFNRISYLYLKFSGPEPVKISNFTLQRFLMKENSRSIKGAKN